MNISLRSIRLSLLAFLFLSLISQSDARAQWQYRSTPGFARFVEMLDYVGKPEWGFVGGRGGLVYTTDNGFTWEPALIKGAGTIVVKDIHFKDGGTGWIASDVGIHRTTDGGATWDLVRSGSFAAVYYNPAKNMVLASGRNTASCESIDDGDTWLPFGALAMNGFAQLNDDYIFHSPFNGPGWFTTNGGVSWHQSELTAEVWQPVPLELSGRYLAISEVSDEVFISDDRGEQWELISTLIDPTGCVLGTEEKLFAQTQFGMYYSTDQGATWLTICGPENSLDTRFWVRGDELFALNPGGQLFYNPNGQPGGYERVQARVDPALHQIVMDTTCVLNEVEIPIQNLGCDQFRIDSVRIDDTVHFQIVGFSPITVEGQTSASFTVKAKTISKGHHAGIVTIYVSNLDDANIVYDTISLSWKPIFVVQPLKDAKYAFTECRTESGAVDIFNPVCAPIRVDSIQITNRNDFVFMLLTFPFEIGPREHFSLTYDVNFPKPKAETNVKVYFTLGDTQYQQNMWVRSSSYVQLAMESDTFSYTFNSSCPNFDTSVAVTNTHCDPMTILGVQALGTSVFTLDLPTLPLTLAQDQSMPIGFSADLPTKGLRILPIRVTYDIYGQQQDTVIHVFVDVLSSIAINSRILGAAFDRTSVCAPKTRTSYITNENCLDLTIERLQWTGTSSPTFKTLYQPTLPRLLKPGERDSIVVEFAPDVIGALSARLDIRLRSAALAKDTFIVFSGIGTGSVNGGIADAKLDLGSTIRCEKLTGQTTFSNDGCEAFDLVSITPNAGSFVLVSPSLPYHLEPGATVPVVFETNAAGIGALQQNVQARIVTAQNVEQLIDLELAAEIVKEALAPQLPAIDLGELNDCRPFDTTISISNPGSCDMLFVEGELLSTNVSFTGTNLLAIPPGESRTFSIRLLPNAGSSFLLVLKGDGFDTAASITYFFAPGKKTLDVTEIGGGMRTNRCSSVIGVFDVKNPSCYPIRITGLDIAPVGGTQTRFAHRGNIPLPEIVEAGGTYSVFIIYDPTQPGTDRATLTIESDAPPITVPLEVTIIEPERIDIAIASAMNSELLAGESFTVDVLLNSATVRPLELNDVALHFSYDTDLLTLTGVDATGEWQLKHESPATNGTRVVLSHPLARFAMGDTLARLTFRSALARESFGVIELQSVTINEDDSTFACYATTDFRATSENVSIAYFCGANTLREWLGSGQLLRNVRVRPQPMTAEDRVLTVSFESQMETAATIELVNVLGQVSGSVDLTVVPGQNEVQLQPASISSGWHLVRIRTAQGSYGTRVLLTK